MKSKTKSALRKTVAGGLTGLVCTLASLSLQAQDYKPWDVFQLSFAQELAKEKMPGNYALDTAILQDSLENLIEKQRFETTPSKLRKYDIARQDVSFLLSYTKALLKDDLKKAHQLLQEPQVSKVSQLPHHLQQDLIRRKKDQHQRFTQELNSKNDLQRVGRTILRKDTLAYQNFFEHARELRDFAEQEDMSTEFLEIYVNEIAAQQLNDKTSENLKRILKRKKRFNTLVEDLIKVPTLQHLQQAKGFVDTCYTYATLVDTRVKPKYLLKAKNSLRQLIAKEKFLAEKDEHIHSNENVLYGQCMRSDTINPTGLYVYDGGVVVITNVPLQAGSQGAQLASAMQETNRILRREVILFDGKKANVDFEDIRPLPYVNEYGQQLVFPLMDGVQARVYYGKIGSKRFTKKFIEERVSKEVLFNENIKGHLGTFVVGSGQADIYSNPVRTVMQYTTNDSIYMFDDFTLTLQELSTYSSFEPESIYVGAYEKSLFSSSKPKLKAVQQKQKKQKLSRLYENVMEQLIENVAFQQSLSSYKCFFTD